MQRMVYPYNPDAWPDKKKMKVGYSIPFTKTFYHYQELEPSDVIAKRILQHEQSLEESLKKLFREGE
jgi:type I restriction enzyme M protein